MIQPIKNHTHYIAEVITEMSVFWSGYFLMVFIMILTLPNILCVSFAYKTKDVNGVKNTYNHLPQYIYIPS